MSVSSVLHSSCDSDLWVRFSGDCFDILLSPLQLSLQNSGSHVLPIPLPLDRSVDLPFASMCSVDEEKVCSSVSAPDQWWAGMLGSWLF